MLAEHNDAAGVVTPSGAKIASQPIEDHRIPEARRWRPALVASASWYPPAGRRHLGVAIVHRCPACSYLHQHRGGVVSGDVKVGSCGATYRLIVTPVVPVQRCEP